MSQIIALTFACLATFFPRYLLAQLPSHLPSGQVVNGPREGNEAATARIHWPQSELQWGYISLQRGRTDFIPFQNRGAAPLRILSVESTCQNISVEYPRKAIEAGAKQKIKVHWTPDQKGQVSCYLTIKSNSQQEVNIISLSGVGFQE